ncbi:MAG: hypothetical protein ABUK01_11615 [Leptospirales bacterium]
MFDGLKRKWHIASLLKKVNKLGRLIVDELKALADFDPLEYGNLRKGTEWGAISENTISWNYLIDLIIGKPILYIITYNIDKKEFLCYAKTPRMNFSSVFQFKTKNFQELNFRLLELAKHIPSLRERMLREYLYSESKLGPRKKWYKPFVSEDKIHVYLESIIDNISTQKKITKNEARRITAYAMNLT